MSGKPNERTLAPPGETPRERVSRERSSIQGVLLSRANTMLKPATLSREASKAAQSHAASPIKQTIATLAREKTTLMETVIDEDEEMQKFLMDMKKHKSNNVKEFTDSDFDTDLEDEIGRWTIYSANFR